MKALQLRSRTGRYFLEKIFRTTRSVKTCRYCFEEIPGSAEVCPKCGGTVVMVKGPMVLRLIAALVIAFALYAGIGLWNSAEYDREFEAGLAKGREVGKMYAAWDKKNDRPVRIKLPARLDSILISRTKAFREGYEKGFFETYRLQI